MAFLYIFLLITAVVGIAFVLLNIRHILTGQPFRGTCASASPFLRDKLGECSCSADERARCDKPVHRDEGIEEILPE